MEGVRLFCEKPAYWVVWESICADAFDPAGADMFNRPGGETDFALRKGLADPSLSNLESARSARLRHRACQAITVLEPISGF
jgi:hypothetical protein